MNVMRHLRFFVRLRARRVGAGTRSGYVSTMQAFSRRRPGAAVLAGALGGLIGAWFKLGWEVPWPPRTPERLPEPAVLVSLFTHVATPVWQVTAVHFTFSILAGMAYGALVEFFPIVSLWTGVAFGLAVWVGAHEIVMPLMHLTPATWRLPPNEQASEFFGHALWGWVIGVFVGYYRPRLATSENRDADRLSPYAEKPSATSFVSR